MFYRDRSNIQTQSISELLEGYTDTQPIANYTRPSSVTIHPRYNRIAGGTGFGNQEIDLTISSSTGITRLHQFSAKLYESLLHPDSFGSLVMMTPSRSKGTTLKLEVHANKCGLLIEKLRDMPEVANVLENPVQDTTFPSSIKRYTVSLTAPEKPQQAV